MRNLFLVVFGAGTALCCTVAEGQQSIDAGHYSKAVAQFSCVISGDPASVEGHRGRIEAELLLGKYSDAVRDAARITAFVLPVHADAHRLIQEGYLARLTEAPDSASALIGLSFSRWWNFDYAQAIHYLNRLLDVAPDSLYGNLFRGSSLMLSGKKGVTDLERGITLAPASAHVRFIAADAFTYGQFDANRALAEAMMALNWGLDTPRIRAILAVVYTAMGNVAAAAVETKIHFDQVTKELVATGPLAVGGSMNLALVPGRVYEIPVAVGAGQTLAISTSSKDFYDTLLVLLTPEGVPVVSSDDAVKYFAGLDWVAPAAGTYKLRVTSFESVNTGTMEVARK